MSEFSFDSDAHTCEFPDGTALRIVSRSPAQQMSENVVGVRAILDACRPVPSWFSGGTKQMIKTVEAVVDERGNVTLLEPLPPAGVRRALVTILEERPADQRAETAPERACAR